MRNKSIIISPHSDDTILSVGGRLLSNPEQEKFSVLNTFSTCASTIIAGLTDVEKITQMNNAEELNALGSIGVGVEFMYLPEVLLRGYKRWDMPPEYPKDNKVRENIRSRIVYLAKDAHRFYFPLGIGNHTDHVLSTDVAIELSKRGVFTRKELFFYEDLPYSFENGGIDERLSKIESALEGELEKRVLDISAQIKKKINLVKVYKSQYNKTYAQKIEDYSERLSGKRGIFFERSWRVK